MRRLLISIFACATLASSWAQAQEPDVQFRWSLYPLTESENPVDPEEPGPVDPEEPGPVDPEEPEDPDDDPLEFDGDFANAGFEDACGGWSGSCNVVGVGEQAASGTTAITTSFNNPVNQTVSLAGSETSERIDKGTLNYEFSFYAMTRASVSTASLTLQWLDENDTVLSASTHDAPVDYFWKRQVMSGAIPIGSRAFKVVLPSTSGLNSDRRYDHMSMGFRHGEVEVARMGEPNPFAVVPNTDLFNWGAEDGDIRKTVVAPGWFSLPLSPGSATSQWAESFAETSNFRQYHGGGSRSFRARGNIYGNVFVYQEVTLAAIAQEIAAGQTTINLSAFANTTRSGGSQPDRLSLQIELLDADNRVIGVSNRVVEPAEITFYYQRFETPDVAIPPTAVAFRARFNLHEVSGASVMNINVDHLRVEVKAGSAIIKTYGAPTEGPVLGLPDFLNPSLVSPGALSDWGSLGSFGWYPLRVDINGEPLLEMANNTQAQQFLSLADLAAEIDEGDVSIDAVVQFVQEETDQNSRACRGSRRNPSLGNASQELSFFDIHGHMTSTMQAERLIDYGIHNANHYGNIPVPAGTRTILYSLSTVGLGATGRCNVRNVGLVIKKDQDVIRRLGTHYDLMDYIPQRLP